MEEVTGLAALSSLIWLLFVLVTFIIPGYRQKKIEALRVRLIRRLEQMRGSRVITMIHRQEALSLLGIPLARFINIEDSEAILRAIRLTPDGMPIDIILHTPGGLVLAAEQIARAIRKHPARVTVFVPHYAMSGGTLLALAADEIVMDENAVLGPVDPQIGSFPAASLLRVIQEKNKDDIDDKTLILADVAGKAMDQVRTTVFEILKEKMEEEKAQELARIFTEGRWTHDYPITIDQLRQMGLNVHEGLFREVYQLMELYPQPAQRRPSVQYIPVPYRDEERRVK